MKSNHQIGLDILNLKMFFILMIDMNMFFYFFTIIFKNHTFKMYLSRFIEIQTNVKTCKSTCK